MTNNPTIDGVSREALLAAANQLSNWGKTIMAAPLWEALAAPVVERQPVHEHDCCANCMRPRMEHCGENCPAPETTVWHAWDYSFAPYAKELPEVAALQSTIAQLQARVQELESGRGDVALIRFRDLPGFATGAAKKYGCARSTTLSLHGPAC